MFTNISHLNFRVLGYMSDDGLWAAHCLETDIVGYGKTFKTAMNDLVELTEMQVTFAFQTKQPSLLDRPADPWVLEIYHTLFREILQSLPKNRKATGDYQVASMPLPTQPDLSNSFVQTQPN